MTSKNGDTNEKAGRASERVKRYPFREVFQENPDSSLTPRRVIEVNGVSFGTGVSFSLGVSFGGVNFHKYKGLDVAAEEKKGRLIIRGFYEKAGGSDNGEK